MTELPLVLCDYREPPGRPAALEDLGHRIWYDRGISEPNLDFGDYSWKSLVHDFTVGVEVKTVAEALSRMEKRQLEKQLRGLHDTYDIPIFLMAGKLDRSTEGYCNVYGFDRLFGYDAFYNWLHHSLRQKMPELRVEHINFERDIPDRLHHIVSYYEKRKIQKVWAVEVRRPLFTVDEDEEMAMTALMAYPTMGEELARRVLDNGMTAWEALRDVMMNGGGSLISQVSGLGTERVKKIRHALEWRKEVGPRDP